MISREYRCLVLVRNRHRYSQAQTRLSSTDIPIQTSRLYRIYTSIGDYDYKISTEAPGAIQLVQKYPGESRGSRVRSDFGREMILLLRWDGINCRYYESSLAEASS